MKIVIRVVVVLVIITAGLLYFSWYQRWNYKRLEREGGYDDGPYPCLNKLMQIGSAFRIWEGNHNGKAPFETSTNEGGVMELVTVKDGVRQNGYLIFQVMSNELQSPFQLVCPQDKSKTVAKDWEHLSDKNVSYIFPADWSNVMVVCPIDGNMLHEDGTVVEKGTGSR
jgi:hypothetical protein